MYTFGVLEGSNARLLNISGNHSNSVTTGKASDPSTSPAIFREGSIGVFSAENPNVRRDGVTLTSVTAGGPADQIGIKAGDVILAIDDHYLFTVGELNEEISRHKPGTKIMMRYRRFSTINDASLVVGRAQ
jgi:S1-C subfamily serine protease